MCGLLGYIAQHGKQNTRSHAQFLEAGLIIDVVRGRDGAGIYTVPRGGGKPGWAKSANNGATFVETKPFSDKMAELRTSWSANAHNRASTIGGSVTANSHPFIEGDIALIHNGTIRNTLPLPISLHEAGVEVDSHCVAVNLNSVEPEAADEEILRRIAGAYTLIWYDQRDKSVNLARNKDRPLHMGLSGDLATLFYMSEAAQLEYLNIKLGLGIDRVVAPRPNMHLKFKEGSLVPTITEIPPTIFASHPSRKNTWQSPANRTSTITSRRSDAAKGVTAPNIPKGLSEKVVAELGSLGISEGDRLFFTPSQIVDRPAGDASSLVRVMGNLDSSGIAGVIYNAPKVVATSNKNHTWRVRPVALRYVVSDGGKGKTLVPCVVCAPESYAVGSLNEIRHIEPSWEHDDADVNGPLGSVMSMKEFMEKTDGGCVACETALMPSEANRITWLQDWQPMCEDCVQVYRPDSNELMGKDDL